MQVVLGFLLNAAGFRRSAISCPPAAPLAIVGPRMTTTKAQRVQIRTLPALNPPLKWAGGKRWLLGNIEPLWQAHRHRRYVEPFCGGLAVVRGHETRRTLLNGRHTYPIKFFFPN